jgi:hypothetical protein
MSAETKERNLQEIGANAYSSIVDMVNALECDYDRLAELREERAMLSLNGVAPSELAEAGRLLTEWEDENGEELKELEAMAGEAGSREDAEQRIQDDPLSIEVRSGWTSLGEPLEAEEFNILLATGGPAVRIVGELDQGEPSRAWLEVQDWFTPWTEYVGAPQDVLLAYARQFYFGS